MEAKGFPPEEGLICDWLIRELSDAKSWEQIHVIMRALANVRRLGEEERGKRQAINAPMRNPVPLLSVDVDELRRRYKQSGGTRSQSTVLPERSEPEPGSDPWESDPDTM